MIIIKMDKRTQRYKKLVNIDFFKKWSNDMAYVLGYFSADGGMYLNSGKSKYLQFVSTDLGQLYNIRNILSSKHKIIKKKRREYQKWKDCYVLQLGSAEMFNDLLALGMTPNKEKSLKFPKVPKKYMSNFVRGYLDGDGCISTGIYKRHTRGDKEYRYYQLKFASGSRGFLETLSEKLYNCFKIGRGSIVRGEQCNWLSYSRRDTTVLLKNIYKGTDCGNRLERKYLKYREILHFTGDVA